MNSEELRQIQAPLKEKYKADPDSAIITLHAEGNLGEGVTCNISTGKKLAAIAGLHPATGGTGIELCSGDMLLEALTACAGVTLKAVATALRIDIKAGTVHAEGDIDFRGTLAVDKAAPVGFKDIRLSFKLDTNATEEEMNSLMKLTERYCVVYQTLKTPPEIKINYSN
ncbi:MAG: OsmC family protein [Ignavibacteria bacterium]